MVGRVFIEYTALLIAIVRHCHIFENHNASGATSETVFYTSSSSMDFCMFMLVLNIRDDAFKLYIYFKSLILLKITVIFDGNPTVS